MWLHCLVGLFRLPDALGPFFEILAPALALDFAQAFLAVATLAIDIDHAVIGPECLLPACGELPQQFLVAHFAHFSACAAHYVIVALRHSECHALILSGLVGKPVLPHQTGVGEQVQCGIYMSLIHI